MTIRERRLRERKRRAKKARPERDAAVEFKVYFDEHGRIACAKVQGTSVEYVRLMRGASLIIEERSTSEFLAEFDKKLDYPVSKAALILANYARVIGASAAALEFLGITDKALIEEAASKFRSPTEEQLKAKPRKKAEPKESTKRAVEWQGVTYASMADLIRRMLEEGEDDDTIFEAMQGAFNAPASRRSYIDYYRKQMAEKDSTPTKRKKRKSRKRKHKDKELLPWD